MTVKKMFDLSGKVAIVTGGGRGIGLKMAVGVTRLEQREKELMQENTRIRKQLAAALCFSYSEFSMSQCPIPSFLK